ncbi:bifunctional diguanylate cyclase/phosphodiesterase [Sphingomonas sp. SUN039]|uniref:putative bifunctional diguanylate cyclase/phosphodiesterase n=1 Tax=Sphingomonas sp. SUN039 TaxID=2937787 RepID=UPI002164878A|nr:bifunctional diguanylate cyclase/phosphodiesterase [Sphingomonas sp. SUN039]UVO52714.1 bifunctional diguanylate cyclase/phosphodiesterase [Sphingomonas sp. SUN039]
MATRAPSGRDRPRDVAERQAYIDALPLPAAIVAMRGSRLDIRASNAGFAKLEATACKRADKLLRRIGAADAVGRVLSGESSSERFQWRDGGLIEGRHFTVTVSPVTPGSEFGRRVLVTLLERTGEVRAGESLRRQTLTDPLSGLANRAGFVEGLDLRIADDGADGQALVLVDLARFSRVNECMGSLGGDELIITVARRLLGQLRGTDLLGRTGANEFAIAVRIDDGPGDVLHVARRVEAALSQPFRLSDFEIKIDCAIGCVLATDGGATDDAEELFRHAQLALKAAKLSKRVEVYQPAALDAARRRFTMETELRRAIERDELSLAFQPLFSLATGQISGFEALARWDHPDGAIPPSDFIAVAEDCGLIVPLGRWALDRAMRTLAAWDATAAYTLPLYMGVNLSPIQVARDDVAAMVSGALAAHRMSGHRLSIELTEGVIVSDPDRASRMLDALKACDAQVAMDDFGTGFSNLASLQKLPIDVLKIDRSFVTDMLGDPDRIAIVRAILSLAQALGMSTTAEGIETPETARLLAALGCTTGQGYHFSRPLGGDAALAFALSALG